MNCNDNRYDFSVAPSGPFDLINQNGYFGGLRTLRGHPNAIVMAFPVERSDGAAAVVLRQGADGAIAGEVHGCSPDLAEPAWRQSLAAISLDVDGSGWPEVGRRDPAIGRLQAKYQYLRPTLFHSPYEAAAAFVIGHRISVKQARTLRARIAEQQGTAIELDGEAFHAFPTPRQLLSAPSLPGINVTKTARLRAIAEAAQQGWLDRAHLRSLADDAALAQLQGLPGVGPFFAQGILYRGAGAVDVLTNDPISRSAIAAMYDLGTPPDEDAIREIAERWRPYRMWTAVLLHVWARGELGLAARRRH